MGFFVDLVAAGLPFARTDPVDEWLQVALALSIEIFSERHPLDPSAIAEDSAVLTDRSEGHEASLVAAHVLRIDGFMTIVAPHSRRLGRRREAEEGSGSPDDAVGEAFRRR